MHTLWVVQAENPRRQIALASNPDKNRGCLASSHLHATVRQDIREESNNHRAHRGHCPTPTAGAKQKARGGSTFHAAVLLIVSDALSATDEAGRRAAHLGQHLKGLEASRYHPVESFDDGLKKFAGQYPANDPKRRAFIGASRNRQSLNISASS
jgi:hypothetical protein